MRCVECNTKNGPRALICKKCGDVPVEDLWKSIDICMPYLLKLYKKMLSEHRNDFATNDNYLFLSMIVSSILWSSTTIKSFQENFRNPQCSIPMLIREKKLLHDAEIPKAIYNFDLMNRMGFLAVVLFYVENLFKSINEILENKFTSKGYSNLIKHTLRELNMNDKKNQNFNALYIPAIVRNTAHGAGLHEDNNYNGKIKGVLFKFKKNEAPPYGSWRHCCFFIENIIEVLEQVMSNRKLRNKKIPLPIHDTMLDWDKEIQKLKDAGN